MELLELFVLTKLSGNDLVVRESVLLLVKIKQKKNSIKCKLLFSELFFGQIFTEYIAFKVSKTICCHSGNVSAM